MTPYATRYSRWLRIIDNNCRTAVELVMDTDCVFCRIASSTEPAHLVWEDESVVAFMGSMPINPGHVLVIPRQHVETLFDLDDDTYSHLALVAKRLARAVSDYSKPIKVGLVLAGWDIPHAHLHIIPMREYHDITSRSLLDGTLTKAAPEELARTAEHIRDLLRGS